ncbi:MULTISPECIES: hypothetical protein [Caballeronia]|uniref:hypothetical protein n=1 Tax=Caballeronia TaxID=1827195 RepID=UPI001F52ADB4|nr:MULTISPECIES: hypothetical protein [Caballeronia]MCI1047559.1 hypothetical protein [Caballeronia zhejiangensis]
MSLGLFRTTIVRTRADAAQHVAEFSLMPIRTSLIDVTSVRFVSGSRGPFSTAD